MAPVLPEGCGLPRGPACWAAIAGSTRSHRAPKAINRRRWSIYPSNREKGVGSIGNHGKNGPFRAEGRTLEAIRRLSCPQPVAFPTKKQYFILI